MMKRAEAESKREYTPYEGQRLADESGDLLSSRSKVRDIAGSGIAGLDTAQSGDQAGMGRSFARIRVIKQANLIVRLHSNICLLICRM